MVRFLYIFPVQNGDILFFKSGSHFPYINRVVSVRVITEMDRNAPEWASVTGMDIKINLFYATNFIILP